MIKLLYDWSIKPISSVVPTEKTDRWQERSSMGAGASQTLAKELENPLDASDVNTPRGKSALDEVRRLRTLLLIQESEVFETY